MTDGKLREMPDLAVQALIVAGREIDVLRRQAETDLPIGPAERASIQCRLREEVLRLRDLDRGIPET